MNEFGKPKSILFINRVFPPDAGATGHILADLSQDFAETGWDVTVLTSRGASQKGIRVELVRAPLANRHSLWSRALGFAFLFPAFLWKLLRLPKQDVVITMTDPPMQLLLGMVIGWLKGSTHIHWCQDVYPEVAEKVGVIKPNGVLARVMRFLSTAAMNRARTVVAVGDCMRGVLIERGVEAAKIRVVPNWAWLPERISEQATLEWRAQQRLGDAMLVMYSGNFGRAHTFDAILDAAESLQRRGAPVKFAFLGDGPSASSVRHEIERRNLSSVNFLPRQNYVDYQKALAAADIHLACLKEEFAGLVVPSKVYAALASGRPCFFVGPVSSHVARTIKDYESGEVFSQDSASALADAIEFYAHDRAKLKESKARAASAAHDFLRAPSTAAFIREATEALDKRQNAAVDLALIPS